MIRHRFYQGLMVGAMFVLPGLAHAQEATVSGMVSDGTGGALPGVSILAVHEASGNRFETVTDERGGYRLVVRVGAYRITAELSGFAPLTRTLTLLVGQEAVVNLNMAVGAVEESVMVTGQAPLLDITQSSLGGNVDSRQIQEVPTQGRNWVDLVILAPGAQITAAGGAPADNTAGPSVRRGGSDFQLNVDGQQVTQQLNAAETNRQPRFSMDAIAEFQYLSSRFDATQGRSSGLQVNAITKSGTNTLAGTFSGYFRDDSLNAADHVAGRVLPYQNQQLTATVGGPILKDKIHFFANYDYEREPQTSVFQTPFAYFNLDLSSTNTQKLGGVRVDTQFTPQLRLAVRGAMWRQFQGPGGSSTSTPSQAGDTTRDSGQLAATLTQVLGTRAVNEIRVGYSGIGQENLRYLKNSDGRYRFLGPDIILRGLRAGGPDLHPGDQSFAVYNVRDDFTYPFTKGGSHTLKLGGEYLRQNIDSIRCARCDGELTANNGPIPTNVESIFPDLFDASTWNLNALSSISVRWREAFGPVEQIVPRDVFAGWVQDDWTVKPRLTLNLGFRYDLERNAFANDIELGTFLPGDRPNDTNNAGPRLGFSFSQDDRTVIRGGYGLYFGTVLGAHFMHFYRDIIVTEAVYDGRPDFASNPWNGPKPTYEQLLAKLCTPTSQPAGCIRRDALTNAAVYGPDFKMPHSHQASIGVQRQFGSTMAIEADYVYEGRRDEPRDLPVNVTYNPETGANYPFTDISRRPFPDWGYVSLTVNGQRSNRHALQTVFTKRFSDRWQASGTYTLSYTRDAEPPPIQWNSVTSTFERVPFETAADLSGEYGLAAGDQRHRAVFNGIWEVAYGFQVSGLYFYGSGSRYPTSYGTDLRRLGDLRPNSNRLRPDTTIVPRNDFVGDPIHRLDLRLQQAVPLGGSRRLQGFVDIFNVFDRANIGSYVTTENALNYGAATRNANVAYAPRMAQLGFRFVF